MRGLLVVVALFLLAACGSSGGKRLSKQEYAKRANAICARFNQQVQSFGSANSLPQLADLATHTLPALRNATTRLRALRPPKDEEAKAKQWMDSLDTLQTDVAKIRDLARTNDLGGVRKLVPGTTADNRRSDRLADSLGATTCSQATP